MPLLDDIRTWFNQRVASTVQSDTAEDARIRRIVGGTVRENLDGIEQAIFRPFETANIFGLVSRLVAKSTLFIGWINTWQSTALIQFQQRLLSIYRPHYTTPNETVDANIRGIYDDTITEQLSSIAGQAPGVWRVQRELQRARVGAADIALLYRRGVLSEGDARAALQRLGYTDEQQEYVLLATERQIEAGQALDAWLRGTVTDIDGKLSQLGYTQPDIAALKSLAQFLPSPSDLLRLALKDVFEPGIVKGFRLDEDFDVAWQHARSYAAKVGLSEDVARLYWRAQWELPSITQSFEMFQRGIINRDELELLFKAHDILPYFRDKLVQLAYNPLTRVDVRRMYRLGVLTKDEVAKAYRDLGYDEANASRLADYVEQEALKSEETEAGKARTLSMSLIVQAYQDRLMTRDDALAALQGLRYSADDAALILAITDYRVQLELAREARSAVESMYTTGVMSDETARDELARIGYAPEAIDELLRVWGYRRAERQRVALMREQRDLTKSELISLYRNGAITRDVARGNLKLIGYDDAEADLLLRNADIQETSARRTRHIQALKTLYMMRRRDDVDILREVDALGLPQIERDALLAEWELARQEREASKSAQQQRLTQTDIKGLLRKKIITTDKAIELLRREGYNPEEITLLLKLWGY